MRLFIAIQLPDEMKKALVACMHDLKKQGVEGNYVPAQNLHLTLAFIGEYDDPAGVKRVLESVPLPPFRLSLSEKGNFGNLLWAGVKGNQKLKTYVKDLREALKEADIPVINLDVRADEQNLADAFIGSDDENAGKVCAQNLTERKPDGGKMVLVENPQNAAINARITGFEEAVRNKGFEVVKRIDAGSTESGVQAEMAAALAEDPQIDAVMCGDDRMALQVLQALNDAGRNDILVYSVGGSPEVKSALADPESPMAGIGAQSPINIGKTAVKTAEALLDGGAYEKEISVETFFINRDNLEMYGTDGWQ